MTSKEIYKKYLEALRERADLENKIEIFVKRWTDGDTTISNKTVEQTVEKGYQRLDDLRKIESQLHSEYMTQETKEQEKQSADISIQHNLGVRPSNFEITGGVLSSNANESHLTVQTKTAEQLESEKTQLLYNIKNKVMNKEISLAEASKLTNDVNTAYEFYDNSHENLSNNNGMHR